MTMRGVAFACLAALAAGVLSGCASATRGWSEQVQFDSEPSGAEVRTVVDNACDEACTAESARASSRDAAYGPVEKGPPVPGPACVTPCTVQVARKDVLIATFSKPGYAPETLKIDTRVATTGAAGFAGNVILGGAVGMVVDAGSGATLEHYPNPAKVRLKRLPAAKPQGPPARRRPPQPRPPES